MGRMSLRFAISLYLTAFILVVDVGGTRSELKVRASHKQQLYKRKLKNHLSFLGEPTAICHCDDQNYLHLNLRELFERDVVFRLHQNSAMKKKSHLDRMYAPICCKKDLSDKNKLYRYPVTIQLPEKTFNENPNDHNKSEYKDLASELINAINKLFPSDSPLVSTDVSAFRSSNILADVVLTAKELFPAGTIDDTLKLAVQSGKIGNLKVKFEQAEVPTAGRYFTPSPTPEPTTASEIPVQPTQAQALVTATSVWAPTGSTQVQPMQTAPLVMVGEVTAPQDDDSSAEKPSIPAPTLQPTTVLETHQDYLESTQTTAEPEVTLPPQDNTTTLSDFEEQCLCAHNQKRKVHGAPPMTWSPDIAASALTWAKTLAKDEKFDHDLQNSLYGENLYMEWGGTFENRLCQMAVDKWYEEVKGYDFENPGYKLGTGHFTQVVWKRSIKLGVAEATSISGKRYVVARYEEKGNAIAEFAGNVPPPLNGEPAGPSTGCSVGVEETPTQSPTLSTMGVSPVPQEIPMPVTVAPITPPTTAVPIPVTIPPTTPPTEATLILVTIPPTPVTVTPTTVTPTLVTTECRNPEALGLQSGKILDRQITASSMWGSRYSPSNARLNFQAHRGKAGAWSSRKRDLKQWLQVDFEQRTAVTGISTQGRNGCSCNQFVKSYSISYSDDGQIFYPYKKNDQIKVFSGNIDRDSIVYNDISPAIVTRFIRINPNSWNKHISMRVEFKGCYTEECRNPEALGLQSGKILDRQITASSTWGSKYSPSNARLNFQARGRKAGAWSSRKRDLNQWLQVDFEQRTVVTGISTQGRQGCSCNQFVRSYTISYSDDGQNFYTYKKNDQIKVFSGNIDKDSIVYNDISPAIVTRFIRINPNSWNKHISMRVEFKGCYKDCRNPEVLGLESGKILDRQMTATSMWNSNHRPPNARLNFQAHGGRTGAWSSRKNDLNQWLQVDFEQQTVVLGISTQGRPDCCNQFVRSFKISFSDDGQNFYPYMENNQIKAFIGNTDKNTIVHNVISPAIAARFIRLNPNSWNSHISMRLEVNGCYKDCNNPDVFGLESGKILDRQMTASSMLDSDHRPQNARLNFQARGGRKGAWLSKKNDLNQWLQVDFEQQIVVLGISTQGRPDCCYQFVRSFTISFSDDGQNFNSYNQDNQIKVFSGNTDKSTIVYNVISPAIVARLIRVHPKTWTGHIAMRMEVNGCYKDDQSFPIWSNDFRWSSAGPLNGYHCVQITETADPNTWHDNYFCSDGSKKDPGMKWSSAGKINGMRCTQIKETADPHTWRDNFLCVPDDSPLQFLWSSAGPIADQKCIQWEEKADPNTWHDNYLCADQSFPIWPNDFRWNSAGPLSGSYCVQITETADPNTWHDNYFCSDGSKKDPGMKWSSGGRINGMRCTQIKETADPHTWRDNFLCVPNDSPLQFFWSSAGPIAGQECIQWEETADPHTWHDNYLCGQVGVIRELEKITVTL